MRRRVNFCVWLVLLAASAIVLRQVRLVAAEQPGSTNIKKSNVAEKKASPSKSGRRTFLAAAIQAVSKMGDPAGNRRHLEALVHKAARKGAKVIVLPECAVPGYMSADLKITWRDGRRKTTYGLRGISPEGVAETVPGVSTKAFGKLADELDVYLTAPILEFEPKTGKYYNTLVLIDPEGKVLLHYRKLNPWPYAERSWAATGNLGHAVIDTPYGRMGLLICFDINFEPPNLKKLRVDHLLYSIAWVDEMNSDWFPRKLPRIARRNRLNIIGANWTVPSDLQPDWYGYGYSRIINRRGKILAKADTYRAEQIVYAELPIPRKREKPAVDKTKNTREK